MKIKLTFLCCLTILLTTTVKAQTQATQWLRYTVKGEEFSVMLPIEPEMKTSDVFVTRLQKSRQERVVEAKAGPLVYRIYVYENLKPRQSLQDFISEQTKRSDLDLVYESDVTIGKFSGKQYSSHDRDFPSTEQYFASEGRLYRFVVTGATAQHVDARQFFASVMLGKKQEGVEVLEGGPQSSGATGVGSGVGPGLGPRIYIGKEVDTKARLLSKPEPSYTTEARDKQIAGTVILKAVFASSGKVTNIRVVQGLPHGLTERAIDAARKIKFVPATKEGKYVSMWMQIEYNFSLY